MKKKIIIVTIVLALLIFFAVYMIIIKEDKSESIIEQIEEIIDKKENRIIYIYNSDVEECPLCVEPMEYFKYYEETYGLDLLKVDYKNIEKEERKKIEKILLLDELTSKRINLIYIKTGEIIGQNIGEISNDSMLEDLHNKGYISEEKFIEEKQSEDTEIFNVEEKTIVLLGTNNKENINEIKTTVKRLAKEYKIDYRYMEPDLAVNEQVRRKIREEIGDYNLPTVIIIQNKKIVKYTSKVTEEELKKIIVE